MLYQACIHNKVLFAAVLTNHHILQGTSCPSIFLPSWHLETQMTVHHLFFQIFFLGLSSACYTVTLMCLSKLNRSIIKINLMYYYSAWQAIMKRLWLAGVDMPVVGLTLPSLVEKDQKWQEVIPQAESASVPLVGFDFIESLLKMKTFCADVLLRAKFSLETECMTQESSLLGECQEVQVSSLLSASNTWLQPLLWLLWLLQLLKVKWDYRSTTCGDSCKNGSIEEVKCAICEQNIVKGDKQALFCEGVCYCFYVVISFPATNQSLTSQM